jgi:hypothetical protein
MLAQIDPQVEQESTFSFSICSTLKLHSTAQDIPGKHDILYFREFSFYEDLVTSKLPPRHLRAKKRFKPLLPQSSAIQRLPPILKAVTRKCSALFETGQWIVLKLLVLSAQWSAFLIEHGHRYFLIR